LARLTLLGVSVVQFQKPATKKTAIMTWDMRRWVRTGLCMMSQPQREKVGRLDLKFEHPSSNQLAKLVPNDYEWRQELLKRMEAMV